MRRRRIHQNILFSFFTHDPELFQVLVNIRPFSLKSAWLYHLTILNFYIYFWRKKLNTLIISICMRNSISISIIIYTIHICTTLSETSDLLNSLAYNLISRPDRLTLPPPPTRGPRLKKNPGCGGGDYIKMKYLKTFLLSTTEIILQLHRSNLLWWQTWFVFWSERRSYRILRTQSSEKNWPRTLSGRTSALMSYWFQAGLQAWNFYGEIWADDEDAVCHCGVWMYYVEYGQEATRESLGFTFISMLCLFLSCLNWGG